MCGHTAANRRQNEKDKKAVPEDKNRDCFCWVAGLGMVVVKSVISAFPRFLGGETVRSCPSEIAADIPNYLAVRITFL
jgi:hypothetical protein